MKKLPISLVFAIVLAIVAAALLWPADKTRLPPQVSTSPSPAEPQEASLEKPQVTRGKKPALDAWTQRLIETHTPDESKIDLPAVRQFNRWARAYAAGTAQESAGTLAIARQRRAALKELIKQDPQAAWDEMLTDDIRAALPTSLQPFLEEALAETGDWEVFTACFWNADQNPAAPELAPPAEGMVSTFHEAVFDRSHGAESRYHAFPAGLLSQAATTRDISLQGFAIDDIAVFDGLPLGRLEAGTPIPASIPIHTRDPYTGEIVIDNTDLRARSVIPRDAFAAGSRDGIHFFENERSLEKFEAALLQAGTPGGDEGEEVFAEAPDSSVTGEPDSLPLSGREGGVFKGGQSLGYRTMLYMRIAFADDPTEVVQTEANAYSILRSVNNHLLESSYGRMQVLPTVTPILVLPEPQSFYATEGTGKVGTDARAAASALGYNPGSYGHRVYRYSGSPGTFGGLASVGGNPGNIWMRNGSTGVLVHEMGHNYKLGHSNGWVTNTKAAIGPSSSKEYDHNYCVMASGYDFSKARYCSYQKNRIGWLTSSEFVNSLTSGRHRIHAIDDSQIDPGRRYAIKIATPSRGNYWAEYRNNYTTNAFKNGLFLQAQGGGGWGASDTKPNRIDVTYWSKKNEPDSTIPIGWTFSDHGQGVHITPLARADDFTWIDVQVHHIDDFTENNPPTATLSASTTTPGTGQSINLSLTGISDPDGDELRYYWYYDANDHHAFRTSTNTSRNKSWSTAGVYNVVVIVSDMKGGTCVKSIPITVGSPSNFTIAGQVIDHAGNGVAGVAVDNGLGFSDTNYRATLTDADGNYTLGRLPAADYTVRARKDFDAYGTRGFSNPVAVGPSATGIGFRARALQVTSSGSPSENGTAGQFVVTRIESGNNFTGDIDFNVSFTGSAVEGTDYTLSPAPAGGVYSLPGAQDSLTITVTPVDDADDEGPEDLTFSLGMTNDLSVIDTTLTSATLLLEDNENSNPRVRAIPRDRHFEENGGVAEVLFLRYGDTTNAITVNIGTGTGPDIAVYNQDYAFDTGAKNITIPEGASSAVLQVIGLDDSDLEGFEETKFWVNTGSGYKRDRRPTNIVIDIADNEIPEVTVTAADSSAGEGNNGLGAIRFTRSISAATPLTIEYGVRGSGLHGTDYAQLSGAVTIPADATTADVTIEGLPDALIEGTENAILRASVSNDSDYYLGASLEGSVSINDKPILTLSGPGAPFSELNPAAGQFTINRVGPNDAVAVTLDSTGTAEGGADFTYPATVNLPANQSSLSFNVTPLTDAVAEGDEMVTLNIVPLTAYGVDVSPSASQLIEDLPIDAWRLATFGADANNAAIAGDFADPEKDSQTNLYEYGTVSQPLIVDLAELNLASSVGFFSVEFKRRKNSGVTVQCLWSATLGPEAVWSSSGITEEILEDTPVYTRVRATTSLGGTAKFLKVNVSR